MATKGKKVEIYYTSQGTTAGIDASALIFDGANLNIITHGKTFKGTDTNTWRSVKVNSVEKLAGDTSSSPLDVSAGDNISLSFTDNKLVIAATDTTYSFKNLSFKNNADEAIGAYKPTLDAKTLKAGTNVEMTAASNIITISATDTTYVNFVGSGANAAAGLVPKPSTTAGATKFLREDGGWQVPDYPTIPSNNVTGSGTNNYIAKWNGTNTITNGPAFGSANTFLQNNGNWATPENTWVAADLNNAGYVPKGVNGYFLSANANGLVWVANPNTNTHRPIQLKGTQILGDNTTALNFAQGTGITLSSDGGTITITNSAPDVNHNTDANVLQENNNGNYNRPVLMKYGDNSSTANVTNRVLTCNGVTINPSTNSLSVSGNLSVTGTASFGNNVTATGGISMGSADLSFKGSDPGDIVWYNSAGSETERIWSQSGGGSLNYRTNAGSTYSLIHSGNYSSYALPLSGGTLTGGITINSNRGGYLGSDGVGIYIQTGSHWLRCGDGGCDYDGQGIIHAGNISSQTVSNSDLLDGNHGSYYHQRHSYPSEGTVDLNYSDYYQSGIRMDEWGFAGASSVTNRPYDAAVVYTFPGYCGIQLGKYYSGHAYSIRGRYNGTYESWVTLIHSGNIGSQSVNYASSAGSVSWSNVSDKPNVAIRASANNLLCAGNEFNFISAGFSGGVWFNYQDENRANAANIDTYYFGNGRGGALAYIQSGYFSGTAAAANSVSWSNVTGKPSTFTPSDHSHNYLPLSGGYMDGNINCNYEYTFIGYMPRMISGGGGWAYDVVAIRNPAGNRILNLGVYGGEASLSYVYLSAGGSYYGSGFRVDTSGNCTATGNMYANSDRHLKKNISSIPTSSLERLFNVSDKLLKKYTLKQTGKESYGFIAQEIEQYIPEAVTVNDPNNMKSVSYNVAFTKIIAALVQKMKSMDKEIKKLKRDRH